MGPDSRMPPPEALLIRRYREAMGISPETAVTRLGIKMSARRWRQLEAGEETRGGKPAAARAAQLAHMARVVGAPPERLEEIDTREAREAAEILRVMGPAQRDGETGRDAAEELRLLEQASGRGEMPLRQLPGETDFEYADRMYAEWQRIRDSETEADRLRARGIRGLLDRGERGAG